MYHVILQNRTLRFDAIVNSDNADEIEIFEETEHKLELSNASREYHCSNASAHHRHQKQ